MTAAAPGLRHYRPSRGLERKHRPELSLLLDECAYQVEVHRDETHPAVDARIEVDFAEGEIDVARCPAPTAVQKDARAAAGEDATVEAIDAPTVSSASEPPGTECRYDVVYRDDADHCG